MIRFITLIAVGLWSFTAHSELNIEITHGMVGAAPIAITPFNGEQFTRPSSTGSRDQFTILSEVIKQDLRTSGRFAPLRDSELPRSAAKYKDMSARDWQQSGAENVVMGEVDSIGNGRYNVRVTLLDVFSDAEKTKQEVVLDNGELVTRKVTTNKRGVTKVYKGIKPDDFRALAHHISDVIYEQLTGIRGAFSTRIAYIVVKAAPNGKDREYILEVADVDGHNPKQLVKSSEPLMSPSWSPDGRKLAFVSFENKRSEIYTINVKSGQREHVTGFPGINGAPAWSNDGRSLALVLSKNGSPNIYSYNLSSERLVQLTNSFSINTEPHFTPDGQGVVFTSNRGGKPQIYRYDFNNAKTQRLTFEGNYNARASFTPNGDKLVMLHRGNDGLFRIATQDMVSGNVKYLTNSKMNESPSVAPNGTMILYGTIDKGRRVLGVVSIDGRGQLRLPAREGSVQEPAWSPFIS